ncbi:unnamed protein product, partial [Ascophyllum nodosum]
RRSRQVLLSVYERRRRIFSRPAAGKPLAQRTSLERSAARRETKAEEGPYALSMGLTCGCDIRRRQALT